MFGKAKADPAKIGPHQQGRGLTQETAAAEKLSGGAEMQTAMRLMQMQRAAGNQAVAKMVSQYLIQRNTGTTTPPVTPPPVPPKPAHLTKHQGTPPPVPPRPSHLRKTQGTPPPVPPKPSHLSAGQVPATPPVQAPRPAPGHDPRLPDTLPNSKAVALKSFKGAHMRDFKNESTGTTNPPKYQVDEGAMIGARIGYRGEFEIYPSIKDSSGTWVLAKYKGEMGFVRENKVGEIRGLGKAHEVLARHVESNQTSGTPKKSVGEIIGGHTDDSDAFDDRAETAGEVGELLGTGPGAAGDSLDEQIEGLEGVDGKESELEGLEKAGAGVGVAGAPLDAVMSGLGGIVAMKNAMSSLKDDEKSNVEKGFDVTESAIDATKSVQEGVEVGSGFVDNIGTLANTDKVETAGAVGEWSGSVGEAITAIKSAFFVVKEIYETFEKAFSSEGIGKDELVTSSLSVISNSLQAAQGAVKTVKAILDILKVGGVGLGQAIPGLGIAISGITITIKVYEMIKSTVHVYRMTKVKRDFKEKYKAKGRDYVGKKEYKLFGHKLFNSRNDGTDKQKLDDRKNALTSSTNEEEQRELQDIKEYELAKEMKNINKKRLTRAGVQVGLEMVSIAGDIATLTGYGAQVGVPLKAAAAATGVSMSIARKAKQFGRDRAAKPGAWRVTKTLFNANKSSAVKNATRERHGNLILQMIADLPEYKPGDKDIKEQYRRVENFIASTGISPKALYRLNGNPKAQRKLLMEGMKKRE